MSKRYIPPKQKGFGQFIDCIFLIVLVYASLMAPLLLHLGGNQAAAPAQAAVTQTATWESLHQNKAMQAQWEKLGYTPEKAADLINQHFEYKVDPLSLGITAAILLIYWIFVLRFSEREYRDVIGEHFDRNRQ